VEEVVDILDLWNQDNTVILNFLVVNMLEVAVMDFHILDQMNLDNSQKGEVLGDTEDQLIQGNIVVDI
jgi:hypothetical protein